MERSSRLPAPGGGFEKFLAGETDINDASRPVKAKEADKAAEEVIFMVEGELVRHPTLF